MRDIKWKLSDKTFYKKNGDMSLLGCCCSPPLTECEAPFRAFVEFGTPSTPPKYYRNKTIHNYYNLNVKHHLVNSAGNILNPTENITTEFIDTTTIYSWISGTKESYLIDHVYGTYIPSLIKDFGSSSSLWWTADYDTNHGGAGTPSYKCESTKTDGVWNATTYGWVYDRWAIPDTGSWVIQDPYCYPIYIWDEQTQDLVQDPDKRYECYTNFSCATKESQNWTEESHTLTTDKEIFMSIRDSNDTSFFNGITSIDTTTLSDEIESRCIRVDYTWEGDCAEFVNAEPVSSDIYNIANYPTLLDYLNKDSVDFSLTPPANAGTCPSKTYLKAKSTDGDIAYWVHAIGWGPPPDCQACV